MNKRAYCIYINTVFQGSVLTVTEEDDEPVVFDTQRDAQLEIVRFTMIRLQEFIDGERDFHDAVTVEEYVVEVDVLEDGSVVPVNSEKIGGDS